MPALTRLRALPWLALFEVFRTLQGHLAENLSAADRRRVSDIVRKSKGDPRRVSARDREELRRIAGKLNLATLARDLAPSATRLRRGGGRGGRR